MPVVTDIQQQQKHGNLFSVYVDDKYAFSLPDLELSGSGLRIGIELSDDEVEKYTRQSSVNKAYSQALGLISRRKRSRVEIERYLRQKNYDAETIDDAGDKLDRLGLIDDLEFARSWIADRQVLKPRSQRVLSQELRIKGIDADLIAQALETLSVRDEIETIKALASKKISLPRYAERERLISYLMSRGFRFDQIKSALAELSEPD